MYTLLIFPSRDLFQFFLGLVHKFLIVYDEPLMSAFTNKPRVIIRCDMEYQSAPVDLGKFAFESYAGSDRACRNMGYFQR